jgi:ABC-type nickel/cobalt efflux system permease component RcnA
MHTRSIAYALLSAVLFGLSTPAAKALLGATDPILLAGLLGLLAIASIVALGEPLTIQLVLATGLTAIGVWVHVSENHEHPHFHPAHAHEHAHSHDEHHLHDHQPGDPVGEVHSHWHEHAPLAHDHRHTPEAHHSYRH